jgi:ribonucleotide reductase beta subunit family protein with ferritin-like domain
MLMATWVDEYLTMTEDCEHWESRLSEWERNFIDSIRTRLEEGKSLSLKQTDTLDKIWQKATDHR